MKKKIFTLFTLALIFICGINAQTYHQVTGTEKVSCSDVNIQSTEWLTYSKTNYSTRTKCVSTGETIPNLSSADRIVTLYIKGCESFDVTADGNGTRHLTVKVDGTVVDETVWASNCSSHEGLLTNNLGECKIEISGLDGSVYLSSITLNAPSGPSSDATIKSLTIAGNEADVAEGAYSYELSASFEGTSAEVVITPNSDKAVVTVGDVENEVPGAYTTNVSVGASVTVKVTPESGADDALTYTLSVTKAIKKSSDTSLKSLTVDGVEVMANADDDSKYTLNILFAYDKPLLIVATASDDLSTVTDIISPIVAGGTSEDVNFTVTAEDGSTKEYTLTVTRELASTECLLSHFSINGFMGVVDEAAKTIAVKVTKDYSFSHTPVLSVSELATAAWDKEAKTVTVTAQDGTTNAIYTVNVSAENIAALDVFPTDLSFAAATYTQPVEWIYGASYNQELKDAADVNIVGGYELKKESDHVGIDAGSNLLNIYLAKCGVLTVNVGATGGRYVVGLVGDVECGSVTLTKGSADNLVCTVNKDEPVVVSIRSYKDSDKIVSTGGTRIYSLNATAPQTPDNIDSTNAGYELAIYVADGKVYVSATSAQTVNIYSIDGRLVRTVELTEGDNVISGLVQGMYLLNNHKVVIK